MNRFYPLIGIYILIFNVLCSNDFCQCSELFSSSDIAVMYDEDNYEKLAQYHVDHITWGDQLSSWGKHLSSRKKLFEIYPKIGLKLFSVDIALIQEGGKYVVCDAKEDGKCNKLYWKLRNGSDPKLKRDAILLNRIKKRAILDQSGKIVSLPRLARRGILCPMACVNDPEYKKWLFRKIDYVLKSKPSAIHFDEPVMSSKLIEKDVGSFSKYSMESFSDYLRQKSYSPLVNNKNIDIDRFNFQTYLTNGTRTPALDKFLFEEFKTFTVKSTLKLFQELCEYARSKNGDRILISANATPWDWKRIPLYEAIDFSAPEIVHNASALKISNIPLFCYKMAEAIGKPIFATALGVDWAIIKKERHQLLVCNWIAQAYALGQFFNFPLKSWIPGSWYYPEAKIYPALAEWIKLNSHLFDDYKAVSEHHLILSKDILKYPEIRRKAIKLVDMLIKRGVLFKIVLVDGLQKTKLQIAQLDNFDSIFTFLPKYYSSDTLKELNNNPTNKNIINLDTGLVSKENFFDKFCSIRATGDTEIYCLLRQKDTNKINKMVIHLLNREYLPNKRMMKSTGAFTINILKNRFPKIDCKKAVLHQFLFNGKTGVNSLKAEKELTIYESEKYYHIDIPGINFWGIVELNIPV